MKTYTAYTAFQGERGEVIVLPSITHNPHQERIGIRIGGETVWLSSEEAILLAQQIQKEVKNDAI